MPSTHFHTVKNILDKDQPLELDLTLDSFAGGENTISEDQATKANEARVLRNWNATSLGGMEREVGFTKVGDGGVSYSAASDLLVYHTEGTASSELYGIINTDLVILSGSTITQEDAATFTASKLSHAVSAGDALWITNATDNLYRKTIGNAIGAATGQPTNACARIYNQKFRLVAEGDGTTPERIYFSRSGNGNWNSADTWSATNDAATIDLPDPTQGCAPEFPSGNELLAFTERGCYAVSNPPNLTYRPITSGRGCSAPYSIAKGDEGVFFLSRFPTLGVYLYDGQNFIELTQFNRDVFVEQIDFDNRIFGVYRNKRYYLFYNETGSGASYENRLRVYDTRFGRWMERPVNEDLADNLGYPALKTKADNELVIASSRSDLWYEYDNGTDDGGQNTVATYETKDFSSMDFSARAGGKIPMDNIRMKLLGFTLTTNGTTGQIVIRWSADRGKYSGSQTVDLTQDGDIINDTFTVNTSKVVTAPPDKTISKSFNNKAVGKRFSFQILNTDSGKRPTVSKLKIHAISLEEH